MKTKDVSKCADANKSRCLRVELKNQIDRDHRFAPWIMILMTCLLPVLEGVLVNVWTTAQLAGPAGPCLLVIVIFHIVLATLLIWNEFRSKSSLRILADAADLADVSCATQRELDRRVLLYRMFRESIEAMNKKVCSLYGDPDPFDKALRPVLKGFLESICDTIGVCSNKYTFEVYLRCKLLAAGKEVSSVGQYGLAFFDSPTLLVENVVAMGTLHPVCLASGTDREKILGRVRR